MPWTSIAPHAAMLILPPILVRRVAPPMSLRTSAITHGAAAEHNGASFCKSNAKDTDRLCALAISTARVPDVGSPPKATSGVKESPETDTIRRAELEIFAHIRTASASAFHGNDAFAALRAESSPSFG